MKHAVVALMALLAATDAHAKSAKRTGTAASVAAETGPGPDGPWRIDSSTTVGACSRLIPNNLSIADHKIVNASGAPVTSWGYVDEAGQIVARFTGSGDRVVRLHGQLRGATGSGAWSSSTDMCGGVWRATRG